jgi:hypothetical protein
MLLLMTTLPLYLPNSLLSLSTVAPTTHVKTHKLLQVCKQVVTNLFTSCRQVVAVALKEYGMLFRAGLRDPCTRAEKPFGNWFIK